jgi:RNA polymerase sigma-70 factor (ECF subfamily)
MFNEKDQYIAFETIFKEHYSFLANYAFSILKTEQDAEDVVQDLFKKIWQNTPHVIANENVKFYLLTATKNACISYLRKQAGKTYVQPEEIKSQHPSDDEESSTEEEPMTVALKALALLPPQCGVIFKMSRFGNLTYQQIADELGLSVKTVENQIGKALKLMRDFAKQNNIRLSIIYFFWQITIF